MLAVLGGLSAFGPLAMDMYLPATPTIAAALHAGQSLVQLTLSGCLAGLAIGQLVAGPVSDGIGRRRPLLIGLVAFVALSVACAAAPDIRSLIVLRFLQGKAGAVGVVLSLTIVQSSTYLLLLGVGYRNGGKAPIVADIPATSRLVDPVVQVLVLTDIVIEATITALLLALVVQAHKRFGSIDPSDLRPLRD